MGDNFSFEVFVVRCGTFGNHEKFGNEEGEGDDDEGGKGYVEAVGEED